MATFKQDYYNKIKGCTNIELARVRNGCAIGLEEALKDAEKYRQQCDVLSDELIRRAFDIILSHEEVSKNKQSVKSRLGHKERCRLLNPDEDGEGNVPTRKSREKVATKYIPEKVWENTLEFIVLAYEAGDTIRVIVEKLNDTHLNRTRTGGEWSPEVLVHVIRALKKCSRIADRKIKERR